MARSLMKGERKKTIKDLRNKVDISASLCQVILNEDLGMGGGTE